MSNNPYDKVVMIDTLIWERSDTPDTGASQIKGQIIHRVESNPRPIFELRVTTLINCKSNI